MSTDTLDELAAFGDTDTAESSTAVAFADLVERNPMPAVLAAAAAGAGLMALVALMARRPAPPRPSTYVPPQTVPLSSARGIDYDSLKRQIADLADRITSALPTDAAKQRVENAGDAIADTWGTVRDQAIDVLNKIQPQAGAAVKVARENPVWTALIVGAIGALVGSQMLGQSADAATGDVADAPVSDPSADA